jgi:hypothetical protein
VAASGSGALAQATSDLVPYTLLTAACLGTLLTLGRVRRARARPATAHPAAPEPSAESQAADEHSG